MSERSVRVQVLFAALDRLGAPLRQLTGGTRGLGRAMAETQRELAGLKRSQMQLAQFRGAEQRFQKSAEELAELRARTAAVREEIARTDAPTRELARALQAAEKAEAAAAARAATHRDRLQDLSRGLERAGVDVSRLTEHEERLARETRQTNEQLEAQRARLERIQRIQRRGAAIRETGGKIAGAGAMATAGVTAPLVALTVASIPAAIDSQKSSADVKSALDSMGPKAGRSLEQLSKQASDLQDNSLFDDDDIMKQVTANMLTFGNVSGQAFDRAQLAAVNLTARLGGDLQGRALMVGKALNDPVKGISALTRAGVSLSAEQKEQIKTWVKAGETAKAQAMILDELDKQFGGAAKAQRDADPTAGSQQAWRTFQESLGGAALKILPALTRLLEKVTAVIDSMSPDTLLAVIIALASIGPILTIAGGAITVFGAILSGLGFVAGALGISMLAAFGWIAVIVAALAAAAYAIYANWGPISNFFSKLCARIGSAFMGAVNFLRSLIPSWSSIGKMMLEGLLTALDPLRLARHIMGLGARAVTALKAVLGIKSPSRVFAAIGGHMMAGLDQGLDRGVGGPLSRLSGIGNQMTAAMAGSALMATPAAAGAGTPGRGASAVPVTNNFYITVQGGPGVDMRAQARELYAELKRLQAEENGSSFEDRD
ncbi:hypothetical protein J2W22_003015 [Sphingomonas kyeonggiensis]|uniref:phage tail length tape measure family protein n=1 Tax=Sphingomonas kyeonggiensis TaxID=1268553 RepID=UPI00277E1064|nr:phage tail length tape measure family protein [Sphingomonas kyeonggiensis]MDQ0250951.1 hypothetical protein [Sphingomonas kyeonggiensis]